MQTTQYAIHSGRGITLWRGIPAQIEISGVEDTSGSWLFLADNDFSDGVVLSGTVAALQKRTSIDRLGELNRVHIFERDGLQPVDRRSSGSCGRILYEIASRFSRFLRRLRTHPAHRAEWELVYRGS